MKAKDLMIGDWVNIAVEEYNNPTRIREIGSFWVKVIKDEMEYSNILVTPIPLTPEILEKNGFVRSEVFVEWKYEYEDIYMLWKPFPWLSVLSDGSELKFPCEYVHQLQHALRLCGIEKEIVL